MEVANLLQLADKVLEHSGHLDEVLPLLEDYSEAFDKWISQGEIQLQSYSKQDQQLVLQLAEKHQQIIEYAQRVKDLTAEELKDLKHKGRGLMAYVDSLPKRITGFISDKKG